MTAKNQINEQERQQTLMQFQEIQQQAAQLEQEAQMIEQKKFEFSTLLKQFDEFKSVKKDSKVFAGVGAGIFAQAKIENTDEFLVGVGAGHFVKKSRTEIKKYLEKQVKELEQVQQQVMQNIQMLAIQGQIMQSQMQKE
jgi:prefoldin alpha subunit